MPALNFPTQGPINNLSVLLVLATAHLVGRVRSARTWVQPSLTAAAYGTDSYTLPSKKRSPRNATGGPVTPGICELALRAVNNSSRFEKSPSTTGCRSDTEDATAFKGIGECKTASVSRIFCRTIRSWKM